MKEQQQIIRWTSRLINLFFYLCLLTTVYVVIRVFVATSFRILSVLMSSSMLAGDCVLVDKCLVAARLFDVVREDSKEVNIYRMLGWRNFKRNDVLVFNFPYKGG